MNQIAITGHRGAPDGIKTVIFDFDDTLAETLPARIEAMRRTFLSAGIASPGPEEFVHDQRGVPLQVSLDSFDGGRGRELGLLDMYRTAYWHKEPGFLRLFDGVSELLTTLASSRTPMGVLTSKARDIVVGGRPSGTVVELAELGLGYLAEYTVGIEDVTNPKPDPEGLRLLMDRLSASPEETLVVGDSHTDILAAKRAGCWSCLAGWGVPSADRRHNLALPDIVAEHPYPLQCLLDQGM